MEIKEMLERAHKLFDDVRAILTNKAATAEDVAKAEAMIVEAKGLQARAAQVKEIETARDVLAAETKNVTQGAPSKFRSFGHYLIEVAKTGNRSYRGAIHPALVEMERAAKALSSGEPVTSGAAGWESKADMAEGVGATGGFLVPTEYRPELLGITPPPNSVRGRASIIPMRRRQVNIPVLNQANTTASVPHWYGGITANWTEEAEQKGKTDPTFKQISLTAHKLVCYTVASDELLDDEAIGLASFLGGPMGFRGAIEWHEEYAFLVGTGAGQPLGVVNAGATIAVAPAALIGFGIADVVNMLEAFLPGANGVWMLNQRHLSNLYGMVDPAGFLIFVPNINDTAPGKLFGYPVVFTEKLPLPGTTGSVILCDWKYYLVGDRQGTTIESNNSELFRYDQTSWRAVHRVDGQPWLSAPLTLSDGSSQVSPFVQLSTKST
mgnify:CR=1 FL=1